MYYKYNSCLHSNHIFERKRVHIYVCENVCRLQLKTHTHTHTHTHRVSLEREDSMEFRVFLVGLERLVPLASQAHAVLLDQG